MGTHDARTPKREPLESVGPDMSRAHSSVALVIAVILIASNMRPTIAAVGPLIDQIGADTGLSTGMLGLITAIPLVTWAIVSPFALNLSRRFGMSRAVLWSLVLLCVGTIIRSLPGQDVSLWIGIALIGIALAVVNVLMPAVIKRDFPTRMPVMMAVYTALLGGMGAIASGVAIPLTYLGDASSGWRWSLLITGLALLPFAIGTWAWATRGHAATHRAAATTAPRGRSGIWTDPVAWLVAAYMGLQAATFYMMLTWLATISMSIGRSEITAGIDVMLYQLLSLIGSLFLPILLRGRIKRFIPALLPIMGIIGITGLMIHPETILLWSFLVGLSSGSTLSMSLTLMAERARDHDTSAALSGMSQSVGYVIASIGPVAFGALHAATDGWAASLGLVLVGLVILCVVGLFAGRDRFVLEKR